MRHLRADNSGLDLGAPDNNVVNTLARNLMNAEAVSGVALWVDIDEKNCGAGFGKANSGIYAGCRFANAALLVGYRVGLAQARSYLERRISLHGGILTDGPAGD